MTVPSTVAYYVAYENLRDSYSPILTRIDAQGYAPLLAGFTSRRTYTNYLIGIYLFNDSRDRDNNQSD